MTCEEFRTLLDDDGAAAIPAALAHAGSCPTCGRALERWQTAQRELRAMAGEPAPAFLTARVMAHVRSEQRERSQAGMAGKHWWKARLAPALVVLVVASLGGRALWQALHGASGRVQEARLETAAADKRDGFLLKAAPENRATQAAGAAPPVAPAPSKASRQPAAAGAKAKRAGARAVSADVERDFAPQPAAGAATVGESARERPSGAGGAVGGVLAAAPSAAHPAATREDAAAAPANHPEDKGAIAMLDAMAQPAETSPVAARLTTANGAMVLVLHVNSAAAPPVGSHWLVRVGADRGIMLGDATGTDIGALHPDTLAGLRAANPPPGEYRLSR